MLDKESCEIHDSEGDDDDNFKLPEALSSTIEKIETTLISIFKYTGCKNLCELDRIKAVYPGLNNIEEINELDKLETRNSELLLSEPRKKILKPKEKKGLEPDISNMRNINNIYSWYNYIKLKEDCKANCDNKVSEEYNDYLMQNYYMCFLREKQMLQETLGNLDVHLGNKRKIVFKVTKDSINDQENPPHMEITNKADTPSFPLFSNNQPLRVYPYAGQINHQNNELQDAYMNSINLLNVYSNPYANHYNILDLYQSNPKFQMQVDNINCNYFLQRYIHDSQSQEPMLPSNPFSLLTQNLRDNIQSRANSNYERNLLGLEKNNFSYGLDELIPPIISQKITSSEKSIKFESHPFKI